MGRDSQVGEDCGSGDHFVLAGGHISGGVAADIEVRDGKIVAIGDVDPAAERVDVSGAWIAPAFIDSHVHLAYLPQASQMAAGGVAAAVDLASPQAFLEADTAPLRAVRSGPMITAVGGYPTRSWGQDDVLNKLPQTIYIIS